MPTPEPDPRDFAARLTNIAIGVTFVQANLDNAPTLDEIAMAISEIANELGQYDLTERDGRLLNQAMRDDQFYARASNAWAHVSRARFGVGGVSENYLGVRFADGFEAGIDRDGRASS
jgi:hypothetical protein